MEVGLYAARKNPGGAKKHFPPAGIVLFFIGATPIPPIRKEEKPPQYLFANTPHPHSRRFVPGNKEEMS
jgi:hypothetical protein